MDTPSRVLNECFLLSCGAGLGVGKRNLGLKGLHLLHRDSPQYVSMRPFSNFLSCLFHSLTLLHPHICVFSPLGLSRVSNSNSFRGLSGKEYT